MTHPDGTALTAATEQEPSSKPKERVLLPTNVTPSHYDVSLTPWQEYKEEIPGFTGDATVTVSNTRNLTTSTQSLLLTAFKRTQRRLTRVNALALQLTVNEPTDTIVLNALELDIVTAAFNGDHTTVSTPRFGIVDPF